ncbi:MAG: hypothetical protein EOO46_18380, partial [Flavobacterium sp.]
MEDHLKPELVIYSSEKELQTLINATNYPYLSYGYSYSAPKLNLGKRIVNKIFATASQTRPFELLKPKLDKSQTYLYWIPDFQEHFLPTFFSADEIELRKTWQASIVQDSHKPIVFSSKAACSDFRTIYPKAKNKSFVVPFAVIHPEYKGIDIDDLKGKFGIKGRYFISPNQFWAHKNHICIVEAVNLLKQTGIEITVVFTGKEHDYRDPEYTHRLKKRIEELKIQK